MYKTFLRFFVHGTFYDLLIFLFLHRFIFKTLEKWHTRAVTE